MTAGRWPGMTWLTLAAAAAVVAINLVGFWEIATARRDVVASARRTLALATAARSRAIEARLAQARGDLAFMAGSPVFFELEEALVSRDERMARWRRLEAEGALLLFLRGHPEVMRAVVRGQEGGPILEAARRGGVPVLWTSDEGRGRRRAIDPVEQPVRGRFEPRLGTRTVRGAVSLDVTVDAARLLSPRVEPQEPGPACVLRDAGGEVLAADPGERPGRSTDAAPAETASAAVAAEGWSAASPWSLACRDRGAGPLALLDPLAARYRSTLLLNLMVMSLAVGLGGFAIHQARRRREMEMAAREEARVRELERRLFHAERLGTVGRLAAGMAHEINNPLEGMSNYLALARDALARGDVGEAGRSLGAATEGLRRASAVVEQVLAHADPSEAPAMEVDIVAAARDTLAFVGSRPEFAGIRFDVGLPDGLPKVIGRPVLLGQVLLNLVLNACEAQPEGGEVRVAARAAGGRVVVEIADRGPGVPPSDATRIFEPFFSTKHSSGLGLSVCHAIVTGHGGAIAVDERPGGGASFRIDLPAAGGIDAGR